MKWEDFRRSDNVEDRTGMDSGGGFPGGGGMKLGGGALILIVDREPALRRESADADRRARLRRARATGTRRSRRPATVRNAARRRPAVAPRRSPHQRIREGILRAHPRRHRGRLGRDIPGVGTALRSPPKLVLFRGAVQSACGRASAAVGPFYCSQDRAVYLDTAFFDELSRRFKAPGDFAHAYVIAHEIGHHVQNLTGTMQQVDAQMQRQDERGRNALSVRLELQADCYAGVWGYFAQRRNVLDVGDLEEGFTAASAIGDDQIQKRTQGYVVPDSFTHGSSEQRLRWFKTGLASGDLRQCNTFAAR